MSEEIIDSLLERAEEMLKGNNSREIGAEEIITILKEYKKLQEEIEELKKMRNIDKELLKAIVASEKNYIHKGKIRTEIKELEEILEKRKTIDIIEEINRLEELLGE